MDNELKRSPEYEEMLKEYDEKAEELVSKYGPEGAWDIAKRIEKICQDDYDQAMKQAQDDILNENQNNIISYTK